MTLFTRARRTAGVAGAATVLAVVPVGVTWAAPPPPVSGLRLSNSADYIYLDWTAPADTSAASVCWTPGTAAPAAPDDAGASCSGPMVATSFNFRRTPGQDYAVSVFSYRTSTQEYGPPASANAPGTFTAPAAPRALASHSLNPTALGLTWSHDFSTGTPAVDFLVSWTRGLSTPDATVDPAHTTWSNQFAVHDLDRAAVYTFAVRVRDSSGNIGPPALLRAATRRPSFILRDNNHPNDVIVQSRPRIHRPILRAGVSMPPGGRLQVIGPISGGAPLAYSHRTDAGSWTHSVLLDVYNGVTGTPHIDAAPNGRIGIAWTVPHGNAGNIWFRSRDSGRWSDREAVSGNQRDDLLGLTADGAGHVHLLVRRTGAGAGLVYFSRGSAGWVSQHVAGSDGADSGLLARDPVTNDVVLVDFHRDSSTATIRYAVLAPTARRVGSLTTWSSSQGADPLLRPTSVTSDSGRITLAVQRLTADGSPSDGPYLMSARGASHHPPVRIEGTSAVDDHVVVTSLQPGQVVIMWRRKSQAWDRSELGLWVSQWASTGAPNSWSFSTPVHWAQSAYDLPAAAFRDDRGHLYVTYQVVPDDVRE